MESKPKKQVRKPALGVRVDEEARAQLVKIAERWNRPQREVLELAIRKMYRSVFKCHQSVKGV